MNKKKDTCKTVDATTERLLTQLAATRESLMAGIARYAREAAQGEQAKAETTERQNKALKARFADIKSKLPEIKMDSETGEYFLARDDEGREVFRVRVRRIELLDVYEVPAASADEAVVKALAMKESKPVRWSMGNVKGEVICTAEV